jgi:iron(III) transport system permease protein
VDARTLSLLLNTLYLAAATCAVSVPVGTALAGLLWRTDFPGRSLWRAVLLGMLFVPLFLQTAAWQAGFGLQGWFTLTAGGLPQQTTVALLDGWRGTIWIHSMAALPWVVLIVGIGLRRSERVLEETALLDASAGNVFFRVTLRNSLPVIGAAALWVAVTTAGEMTVTDFFDIRTYAEELYTQIAIGQEPGGVPPSVLWGVVLTVALIIGGVKLLGLFIPRERPASLGQCLTFQLGRWRWPLATVAGLVLILVIGVPVGSLIYKAGVQVTLSDAGRERTFSLLKCLTMIAQAPGDFSKEFRWSLTAGTISASVAVAIGTLMAWWGRKSTGAARFAILAVIAAVFSLPGPVVGLGVIHLLNQPQLPPLCWLYDHTILAPVLALTLKSLPAATLVMWYAVQSIPRELLESAAVDGAGSESQLWHIAIPMRWPAIAAAWLIALAVSLGELAGSILVVPPGVSTLSISIFGLLHYGVEDRVAGVCLALLLIFSGLAATVLLIVRRLAKSR